MKSYFGYRFITLITVISLITFIFVNCKTPFFVNRYQNIKIISEKVEKHKNWGCDHPEHAHYYENSHILTFKALNVGSTEEKIYTTEVDDADYYIIKNNKSYVDCNAGILWIWWIIWFICFAFSWGYILEDKSDYSFDEVEEINKVKISLLRKLCIFFGYNQEYVNKIFEDFNKLNSFQRNIFTYSKMFKDFKKGYKPKNIEEINES